MHRYPSRRCSAWLGVSPKAFTGLAVFSCLWVEDMVAVCDIRQAVEVKEGIRSYR